MKTNKEHIEAIIKLTFDVVTKVYEHNLEKNKGGFSAKNSRILFPQLRGSENTRISEQELKFVFVEQLYKYLESEDGKNWDVYYSVETPTIHGYVGFSTPSPEKDDENGRSGCIDMVIHNSSGARICLIEFKAKNPGVSDYTKDFCKLKEEGVGLGYFLQIVENTDSGTKTNIEDKVKAYKGKALHYCYCLNKKEKIITPND